MTETATLGLIFAAVGAILLALLGVVWAMLTGRIAALESLIGALTTQNTQQEIAIGRLTERMVAREDAHAQHREDMSNRLDRIEGKLDKLLGSGGRTPYPTRYGVGSGPERK